MKVYYSLEKQDNATSVALGFFDGMHRGHQKVISRAVEYGQNNLKTCVLTFAQNPRSVVENYAVQLLMTPEQKLSAIENMGIDIVYMLDFNDIKRITPKGFVKDVLYGVLNAKIVVCGFNYHFGSGGRANAEDLKSLCKNYKIDVRVEPAVTYKNEPISSTRIRNAIKNKEFEIAENMLF